MASLLSITALLFALFFFHTVLPGIVSRFRNARKARELGCETPPLRKFKLPLALDAIYEIMKADQRNQVPNEFENIFNSMGTITTWKQYILGQPSLVTCDPKVIKAMLAHQFKDFELGNRRKSNFYPLLGVGIFTADGRIWEHSRKLLRPQFDRGQVGDLELEETHVQDMFQHMTTDASGWTPQVDLQPLFFRLTLDSATEFLFGESVGSQPAALAKGSGEKRQIHSGIGMDLAEVGQAFDRGIKALGIRGRFSGYHWLYNPQSFRDDCQLLHKFADYYVNLAFARQKAGTDSGKIDASGKPRYVFLDELVKATQDPVELRSQLLNILLAGRDTTAGLLGWTFWELARHPDVFAKLRADIVESFGADDPSEITFSSLKACSYLQHVLSEVLRLFPSVPINAREAVVDTTLPRGGGPDGNSPVFVPKGTTVDYCVYVMHRRKDLWGDDADEFKPERWQGRKVDWEFLPFNGGPRICLGQQFALTEAGYVIARMLQRFDRIENLDTIPEADPQHQFSVTSAPWTVPVKLHLAADA